MSAPSTTPSTPAAPPTSPEAKEIKADLQIAAAMLTAAVISKVNVQLVLDPTWKDQTVQNLSLMASQGQKVFYSFLDAAENNTGLDPDGVTINGWADPVLPQPQKPTPPSNGAPGLPPSLAGLLSQLTPAAVQTLEALLAQAAGTVAPTTTAPAAPAQVLGGS